jgi:hypothetical protein
MGVDHVVDVDGRYETPPRDVLRRARHHWRAPGGWGQVVEGDVAIELERRWKLEHAVTAHTVERTIASVSKCWEPGYIRHPRQVVKRVVANECD